MFVLPQFLQLRGLQISMILCWGSPCLKRVTGEVGPFHEFTGGSFLAQAKRAAGETAGTPLCESWWKCTLGGNYKPQEMTILKCQAFHGDDTLSNLFLVLSFQLNLLGIVFCEIHSQFSCELLVKIGIKLQHLSLYTD